jgi:hypothetical protein
MSDYAYNFWLGGNGVDTGLGGDPANSDFTDADNWSLGVAPLSSHILVFSKYARVVPSGYTGDYHTIGNHYNCYTNTATTLTVGGIIVDGYTGKIGANDANETVTPLKIAVAAGGEVRIRGESVVHLTVNSSGVADSSIPLVVFDSEAGELNLRSDVNSAGELNIFDKVVCLNAGTLNVIKESTVGCAITSIYSFGTTAISIDEDCYRVKAGGSPIDLYVYGGTVASDSRFNCIENYGATIHIGKTDSLASIDCDVSSLINYLGQTVWRTTGTISYIECNGGEIEVTGDGQKTIGPSGLGSETVELLINSGKVDFSNCKGRVNFATNAVYELRGGELVPPIGYKGNFGVTYAETY